MATILIAQVELIVFLNKTQFKYSRLKTGMLRPRSALASVWLESFGQHPQWQASATGVAVRPVSEHAAASKTLVGQFGVG